MEQDKISFENNSKYLIQIDENNSAIGIDKFM